YDLSLFLPTPTSPLFPYTTLFRSYGTEDRDPQSARHLVGIAKLGVDPIEHDGPAQPQRQAGGESQEHDARGRVPHRVLRHDRVRSEEHTSELQSLAYLVCRLLLEK